MAYRPSSHPPETAWARHLDQVRRDRDWSATALFEYVLGAAVLLGLFPSFGTGVDERMYREAALRWLGGGPFYLPHQLAGPYVAQIGDVMYPPVFLWLFVPMALTPPQVWYALPIVLIAWNLHRLRPAWWAWPVLLVVCAWPWTMGFWLFGNPKLWICAGLFVLVGRSWTWWVGAAFLVSALALPFGHLWVDWLLVMRNAHGMEYQGSTWVVVAIPLVAWLGHLAQELNLERGRGRGIRRHHVEAA